MSSSILQNHGNHIGNDFSHVLERYRDEHAGDVEDFTIRRSKYYDINAFTNMMKSHLKSFSLLSLNIAGIKTNFPQFEVLIDDINSSESPLSIILLQETHLNSDQMILYNLPGYSLVTQDKFVSSFGGLAIYVSNEMEFEKI